MDLSNSDIKSITFTIVVLFLIYLMMCSFLKRPMMELLHYVLEKNGLGYSCALADIYFYGYLKIVLPSREDETGTKGIEERVRFFRTSEGLDVERFPVERLFLLVTSSGFILPNIADMQQSRNRIERRSSLKLEPVLKRNGVKNRTYETTVYTIFSEDKKEFVYVVMEAAPCLRTLRASTEKNPALKTFRTYIIKKFTERLQILLSDNMDCQDKCVIIYCDEDDLNYSLPDDIWNKVMELKEPSIPIAAGSYSDQRESIPKWLFLKKINNFLDNRGLGYASAMADNYFYGYLKIVLPDKGSSNLKGIHLRIEDFISDEKFGLSDELFPSHKLFVLVTYSGYTPRDISEYRQADGRIKMFENLSEEPILDRNGVNRSYKTTVYQVFKKNKKDSVYLVMEGAPCLRQLYEAAERNSALKKLKMTITNQFISHLKERLSSEEFKNNCDIILFDDINNNVNLADLILRTIYGENK